MSVPHKTLRAKTVVMIICMIGFGSIGDVLLGKGMKGIGAVEDWSPSALLQVFAHTFTSPTIWLAILFLLLFFLSYLLVLTWADYSYVVPASASAYAIVPLMGFALLGEEVSLMRWAGVFLICLGVFFVGATPPSTTSSALQRFGEPK